MDPLKRARPSSTSLIPFPRVGRSVDSHNIGGYYGEKRTGKSSSLIPFPRVGRRSGPLTWDNNPELVEEAAEASKQKRQRLVPFPRVGKRQALIPFPRTGKRAENSGVYGRNSVDGQREQTAEQWNSADSSVAEVERQKLANTLKALQMESQRNSERARLG
ncbi:unnamed protein product [Sphagnum tenellum]